ncbi:hypothetical protein XELAEV_18024128mg [Xenopus laevis]|uniref:Uncharacterized protein n=1 Tax=Xenopus laevis TaxID=8355 RepID=A0A974D5E1_XENLA|nr:hypothetical protein XELAEV_18024128mg [Xenopus laevis]
MESIGTGSGSGYPIEALILNSWTCLIHQLPLPVYQEPNLSPLFCIYIIKIGWMPHIPSKSPGMPHMEDP